MLEVLIFGYAHRCPRALPNLTSSVRQSDIESDWDKCQWDGIRWLQTHYTYCRSTEKGCKTISILNC